LLKHAAFFDVDETLINIKSMFDFYDFWCRENNQDDHLQRYMSRFRTDVKNGVPRETLNREYYRQFKDVSWRYLEEMGEKWFKRKMENSFFIESAVSALKKHQSQNMYTVFISGSMLPILSPIAKYLGVTDVLCAPVIINGAGELTGEIGLPQTIGTGKKDALMTFCREKEIYPADCYAYGDDLSDIPMLEAVGYPVCVGERSALNRYATEKNWHII